MAVDDERASAEIELKAIEREIARRRMLAFVTYTNPAYQVNWHHERLASELDAVVAGTTKRLMVFMPPQNGKSEQVSRRFPAFVLGKHPEWPIIACSYGADLSTDMSRDVQKVIDSEAYRALFPGTRLATARDRGEQRNADAFDVVGKAGRYESAGVGGSITGKSMMLGIIDDPVKSREEAESEAYRRRVWNWYVGDFSTRMVGDDTRIVLCQTRWHEDDLAGRLLKIAKENPKADQWRVLNLPAICMRLQAGDPRALGDALWPTKFSKDWLEAKRIGSGVYDWSALYQQEPVPSGGAMAQRTWFKVREIGRSGALRKVRCWDLAATVPVAGQDPDYTVGTLLAQFPDKTWDVEHVIRTRTSPGQVDRLMLQTAHLDGRHVLVREFQDPGQAGKSQINAHRTMLAGFDFEPIPQTGEKSTRWRPFLVQSEGGNVSIVQAHWNREWLDEMATIPYGAHDDQADSVAGAFNTIVDIKDLGPAAAAILPEAATDWRAAYFQR